MPGEQPASPNPLPNPLMDPTAKPGKVLLFDLDARFAKDVLARGGAAFADWFARGWRRTEQWTGTADRAGGNREVGKLGSRRSISSRGLPTDAQMGPSGDMGYTWGHFEGHSKDAAGNPVTTSGRYITVWRKAGEWDLESRARRGRKRTGSRGRLLQAAEFVGFIACLVFDPRRRLRMPDADKRRERLKKLSAICLALPQVVREDHGSHASFTVSKKVFAYYLNDHHGDGIVSVLLQSVAWR